MNLCDASKMIWEINKLGMIREKLEMIIKQKRLDKTQNAQVPKLKLEPQITHTALVEALTKGTKSRSRCHPKSSKMFRNSQIFPKGIMVNESILCKQMNVHSPRLKSPLEENRSMKNPVSAILKGVLKINKS